MVAIVDVRAMFLLERLLIVLGFVSTSPHSVEARIKIGILFYT
jgi:hypothetical protein